MINHLATSISHGASSAHPTFALGMCDCVGAHRKPGNCKGGSANGIGWLTRLQLWSKDLFHDDNKVGLDRVVMVPSRIFLPLPVPAS